jgi:glycosidase
VLALQDRPDRIEHPWFEESRRDRVNPKADWYIWRDEPANNWKAAFPRGDSAWAWDDVRGQWYLRLFTPQQPDLDWDVPEVEEAMLDTLRFWLDRGVDGFRVDVARWAVAADRIAFPEQDGPVRQVVAFDDL